MSTQAVPGKSQIKFKSSNAPIDKKPRKKIAPMRRQDRWGMLFVSPFFIVFLAFGLIPILFTTYVAFFNWDALGGAPEYIGFANFKELWSDTYFWQALRNTFSIWFISTVPQMTLALGIATLLANPNLRAKVFWRTVLLVPNITSVLAVAIVFQQLFGYDFGMINLAITWLGYHHIDWVGNQLASHIAIATMINWRWFGYNSLIFLASMQAIPRELYESASLDGANRWQQFRYVTIPQLRNTIIFMMIMGTIGGLQVFAEPLLYGGGMTGGDSRQFSTLTLYLFEQAFFNQRYGYGAVIGIAMTVIIIAISVLNYLIGRRIATDGTK
ncbi:MAG: sugar ABC transporter permease [Actinomycetes bacterium]